MCCVYVCVCVRAYVCVCVYVVCVCVSGRLHTMNGPPEPALSPRSAMDDAIRDDAIMLRYDIFMVDAEGQDHYLYRALWS